MAWASTAFTRCPRYRTRGDQEPAPPQRAPRRMVSTRNRCRAAAIMPKRMKTARFSHFCEQSWFWHTTCFVFLSPGTAVGGCPRPTRFPSRSREVFRDGRCGRHDLRGSASDSQITAFFGTFPRDSAFTHASRLASATGSGVQIETDGFRRFQPRWSPAPQGLGPRGLVLFFSPFFRVFPCLLPPRFRSAPPTRRSQRRSAARASGGGCHGRLTKMVRPSPRW